MQKFAILGASLTLVLAACASETTSAEKAECTAEKAGDELSFAEANAVYECLSDALHAGYKTGDKRWVNADHVANYRNWTQASTAPAAPGFHTGRFLMTWVNDVGASEYLKFANNPTIPAGTVLAKESFSVNDQGKVTKGPLFLMEKVAAGTSPKTQDWYYSMVSAKGVPQGINVQTACVDCHTGNFSEQGGMGYPVEEVRLKQ
ncbi:MAG: cytochrome P460 family protein [Pseudomonadota bacterium]